MLPQKASHYFFIANWKMYFSNQEARSWAATHFKNIAQVTSDKNVLFVTCPSFDTLSHIAHYAQQYSLSLGAQDCSAYTSGAYTGQIDARSLAEIGCSYCIVGHSETRSYQCVSNNDVKKKIQQLLHNNITPIICIGETKEEYEQKKTFTTLQTQLESLSDILKKSTTSYIAYEPIWAIGIGKIPSNDYLEQVYTHLSSLCSNLGIKAPCFIYGGSVDETTIEQLNKIPQIQGVLVGRASTDFQKIKTIVSLIRKG